MSLVLEVRGMSCAHCVATVKLAVSALPGVTGVEVDLAGGVVRVDGTPDATAVGSAIDDAGYELAQSA